MFKFRDGDDVVIFVPSNTDASFMPNAMYFIRSTYPTPFAVLVDDLGLTAGVRMFWAHSNDDTECGVVYAFVESAHGNR